MEKHDEKFLNNQTRFEFPEITVPTKEDLRRLGFFDNTCEREIKPFYLGESEVWAAAMTKNTPVYALYTCGTNDLRVLRKIGGSEWSKIEVSEIDNIYGLLWRIGVELNLSEYLGAKV